MLAELGNSTYDTPMSLLQSSLQGRDMVCISRCDVLIHGHFVRTHSSLVDSYITLLINKNAMSPKYPYP